MDAWGGRAVPHNQLRWNNDVAPAVAPVHQRKNELDRAPPHFTEILTDRGERREK